MTEGPTARGRALSSFRWHLPTPGSEGLWAKLLTLPTPMLPTPLHPGAERGRLEVRAEAALRRQPPNICQSARQPATENRAAMNRNSGPLPGSRM